MAGKDQNTEDSNNKIINKKLSEYNSIIKENEGIYRRVAKKNGLSDSAFWILYMEELRYHLIRFLCCKVCSRHSLQQLKSQN